MRFVLDIVPLYIYNRNKIQIQFQTFEIYRFEEEKVQRKYNLEMADNFRIVQKSERQFQTLKIRTSEEDKRVIFERLERKGVRSEPCPDRGDRPRSVHRPAPT